ncbi:hypothetical protein EMCRGX_G015995 [Ephydatia muelleri]
MCTDAGSCSILVFFLGGEVTFSRCSARYISAQSKMEQQSINVRILRNEPNSLSGSSSQYVTTAKVSKEVGLLYEDFRKGRCTLEEAEAKLAEMSEKDITSVPFSVYVNIYSHHASIMFIQTDMANRRDPETQHLSEMRRELRVFFCSNNIQVINPRSIRRVDLFTEDGISYKIEMNGDRLKSGLYTMFKCYEVIGISDQDIEWSYLMAAQDWYDTAANNCLTFSK